MEDHLSATRRTRIDVQHCLGIQLLLHFKLQGQLGRNLCQSCQAQEHETNSPPRGCGVKHQDKGQESHQEWLGLCLHMCKLIIYCELSLFTCFLLPFGADSATLTTRGKKKIRQVQSYGTLSIIHLKRKLWLALTPPLSTPPLQYPVVYGHSSHEKSHQLFPLQLSDKRRSHVVKHGPLWPRSVVSAVEPLMPSHCHSSSSSLGFLTVTKGIGSSVLSVCSCSNRII